MTGGRPDLVLRGGTIVDGTGRSSPYGGDVAIAGDRIAALGAVSPIEGAVEIDASGLLVSPGFIDIHSHSDFTLLVDPRAVSQIAQGVTTEVIGNCGYGCSPIGDPTLAREVIYGFRPDYPISWHDLAGYFSALESAGPAVNVVALVPNGQLRLSVVGFENRAARPDEVRRMSNLLETALEQGAAGYSTGLEYPSESGASEAEVTELCRVVARHGGLYATHTRNRDERAIAAIEEAIRTAARSGVRLQISHITPRRGTRDALRAIEAVGRARLSGQDVAFDMHTRLFGTTHLKSVLPIWAFEGGRDALARRLADEHERDRMRSYRSLISSVGDWSRIVLLDLPSRPELSRKDFEEISLILGKPPIDCAFDILLGEVDQIHVPMVILKTYTESDLKLTYLDPVCSIGSDATALATDGPLARSTFHGAYSWAAWFFRRMVRETRSLSVAEGIFKITGLPAERMKLSDRGVLAVGNRADIAVFDPDRFGETATTFEPNSPAVGMHHVLVNGVVTLKDGAMTGNRAGSVLRCG